MRIMGKSWGNHGEIMGKSWGWNIYLQNWAILGVNVGKYTIHGAYGIYKTLPKNAMMQTKRGYLAVVNVLSIGEKHIDLLARWPRNCCRRCNNPRYQLTEDIQLQSSVLLNR